MGLFGRKKESDKVAENREQISVSARSIETLVVLARDNAGLIAELKALQEQIKYLTPSSDSAVTNCDKKIKNLLEDLRIVLVKADGGQTPPKAIDTIMQIKVAIADRNAKM